MQTKKPQSAASRYFEILKYHGVGRGMRRIYDQFFQNDLYDLLHDTNTGQILSGEQFLASLNVTNAASIMHYQPVYTAAVRRPLQFLVRNFPVVGASSACFLDLGCGRGKALHVARSTLQHVTLVGVDLHPILLADAAKNLGCPLLPPMWRRRAGRSLIIQR